MDGHTPRLYKAVGFLAGSFGLFFVKAIFENAPSVFDVFGWLSAIIGVVELGFVYASNYADMQTRHYYAQRDIIDALCKADSDVRNAIGAWFPQYNFVYTDQPILCWHNTEVPMSIFREFMKESNPQYTAAERDWKARGATYHRYWNLIYAKLVDIEFVVPESSAGNHSQMWRGKAYNRAWEMWMNTSMNLQELE